MRQPPCMPRTTAAVWRGRVSLFAAALAVALIAVLTLGSDTGEGRISSLDPGPLSAAHAHFTGSACATCHAAFGKGAPGWWQAFWSPSALASLLGGAPEAHRLSAACTGCHGFGGHELLAHNRVFEKRTDLAPTDCLMCHTEHKGSRAPVSILAETQCQACHTQKTHDFARDHPPFPANFPYGHPVSIRFDHASHFGKHFSDPQVASKVPAGGCVGCHVVTGDGRAIRPAAFDTVCASCHSDGIAKRDFVFFRWPEIDTNLIKADEIRDACGIAVEAPKAGADGKPAAFSGVSADPPTALTAYLLGTGADDAADYEQPVQDLARAMMRDGADPLVAMIRARVPAAATDRLIAGLDAERAKQAGCAWAANREYEPPGKAALPGWRAEALELRYTRPGHADPLLKSWIETVAALPVPADAEEKARLQAARKELLSPSDGPGQCLKCHTTSGPADGPLTVHWTVTLRSADPHTRFDHRPHLDLLGPEKTCTSCHRIAEGTAAAPGAGLQPITLANCTTCHAPAKVSSDCQLCHVYHQDHALRKRMMSDAK